MQTFTYNDSRPLIFAYNDSRPLIFANPTCSAELWSTLGDGLFEFGRVDEAKSAYLKAIEINESDVRARFNLAFCHARQMNFAAALGVCAEALALDKTGEFTDRLEKKLHEIVQHVRVQHQQAYLLLINLVSRYPRKDDVGKVKPEERSESAEGER